MSLTEVDARLEQTDDDDDEINDENGKPDCIHPRTNK